MDKFDSDSISQEVLHDYRNAAEQAWSDETRHPSYQGHPQPAAGQCYVTSHWLTSKLGGHVATKGGHYVWMSPDKSHVIDLTGDNFASEPHDPRISGMKLDEEDEPWETHDENKTYRPGPIVYKRADHPLFKGFRVKAFSTENPRVKLFAKRANAALEGRLSKTSDFGFGGDAYPAQEPDAVERYNHDTPEPIEGPEEYNFVLANGKLELSPTDTHEELARKGRIPSDSIGPSAIGRVRVVRDRAEWSVQSNIGVVHLTKVLDDYSRRVGWEWGGITDLSGNKLSHRMWFTYYDGVRLSATSLGVNTAGWIDIIGKTAHINGGDWLCEEGLAEWAEDFGYKLAINNEMENHEDLELYNNADPEPHDEKIVDQSKPHGPFLCHTCGQELSNWGEFIVHRAGHDMVKEEDQHGHFPELDMDQSIPPHFHEREPIVFPLASYQPDWEGELETWVFSSAWLAHYGAHLNGERLGVLTFNPGSKTIEGIKILTANQVILSSLLSYMQERNDELWSEDPLPGFVQQSSGLYKWAAGTDPKDSFDAPIPFLYDIDKDTIAVGQPGQNGHSIKGDFTPGGTVEGVYEPGGKVLITGDSQWPYTYRHFADLWYWSFPHLEITGIERQDGQDRNKMAKISAQDVGQYIRTLAMADPAAWNAYHALKKVGGKVYVVGGAVRDALLQKQPKDIDLMVTGIPADQINHILSQLPGRTDLTGKDFGVFRYRHNGHEVEIALPRTEKSTGDRRVDFDVSVDHNLPVEADLTRRDFTANSIAVSLDTGQVIDPHGGAQDIEARKLKTTHPSSFEEDPTRMVRALVASSRHGLHPDEQTRHEIGQNAHKLDLESRERVQAELDKLFKSDNPAGAIRLAQETGLLKHIFPEVSSAWDFDQKNPHHNHPLGDHLMHVLEGVSEKSTDPDLRLAALLHDIGKPQSQWIGPDGVGHYYKGPNGEGDDHDILGSQMAEHRLNSLKYPKSRSKRVSELIAHHMFPAFSSAKGARKFLNRVGDHADDLLTLRHADMYGKGTDEYQDSKTPVDMQRQLVEQARTAPVTEANLAINGNELMQALGIPPGPQIGQIKQRLMEAVLENPELNTPEALAGLAQGMLR